jgi:hypothetical protein
MGVDRKWLTDCQNGAFDPSREFAPLIAAWRKKLFDHLAGDGEQFEW